MNAEKPWGQVLFWGIGRARVKQDTKPDAANEQGGEQPAGPGASAVCPEPWVPSVAGSSGMKANSLIYKLLRK